MTKKKILSPLSAALRGVRWDRYITKIEIKTGMEFSPLGEGYFEGRIPVEVAQAIIDASDPQKLLAEKPGQFFPCPCGGNHAVSDMHPGRSDGGDTGPQYKVPLPFATDRLFGMPLIGKPGWADLLNVPTPVTESPENELAEWWRTTAENEIDQTVDKAVEYGATDLVDIGRTLGRVAGRELDDQQAAEWGIFFYLEGKLSRWRSAIERGDQPSADTLLDIGVYARMAQRVREVGSWPGVK